MTARPDDAPPPAAASRAAEAATAALLGAVAIVPMVYAPGFYEAFVAPREAWTLAAAGGLAVVAGFSSPGFAARLRAPLFATIVLALGLALPLIFGDGDLAAASATLRLVGLYVALLAAGAALGARPERTSRLLAALGASAVVVLCVGFMRRRFGVPALLPDRPDVGWASTLGNSNALAEFAAPVAVALLAAAAAAPRGRLSRLVGALAAVACVVASESRGGVLALVVGGAVVAAFAVAEAPRAARRRRAAALGGAVLLAAVGVAFLPAAAPWRARFADALAAEGPTDEVRVRLWRATTDLVAAHPWGVGGGRFDDAFAPFRDPREWRLTGVDSRADHPHQEFLAFLAEGGPLGLLGFVALVVLAGRRGASALRRPETRAAGAALLAATAAFAALCLVRSPARHPSGLVVVLPLLAALGPAEARRLGRRAVVGIVATLVAAAGVGSLRAASEDRRLGAAIGALNEGKSAVAARDVGAIRERLVAASGLLANVGSPDEDPARVYRAALAVDELATLREALAAANVDATIVAALPDARATDRLIDLILERRPHYAGALALRAAVARRNGRPLAAEQALLDAIRRLPRAPRFRANLAVLYGEFGAEGEASRLAAEKLAAAERLLAEEARLGKEPTDEDRAMIAIAALATGSDPSTFGRLLAPLAASEPPAALERSAALRAAGSLAEARRVLLVALADAVADHRLLHELAEVDYLLARKAPEGGFDLEARRAFARSRVGWALTAEASGDFASARNWLKLAASRHPRLWDAWWLSARVAARTGDREGVRAALRGLEDAGADAAFLRARWSEDAVLRAYSPSGP